MAYDVLFVDHGNPGSNTTFKQLKNKAPYTVVDRKHVKTNPYWLVSSYADVDNFDFTYTPNVHELNFTHCGVNNYGLADNGISLQHSNSELHINNFLKINRTDQHEIFYVDTGSHHNFKNELETHHNVQTTRFYDSWQKVAKRCANKMTAEYCWIVPSDVDANSIDFTWYPDFWETNYLHIFASKWQRNSGVMFVHRDWLVDTSEFKYRKDFVVRGDTDAYDKFFLDFFDDNSKISEHTFDVETQKIRFFDNHLDTIRRLTSKSTTKYFWVLSGNCDYTKFDFSWIPDEDTYDHLHTFASNSQVYGDTFFIDKNSFELKSKDLANFKHYETINFNKQQKVERLSYDIQKINHYDFAKAIKDAYQNTNTKYFWIVNTIAKQSKEFTFDFAPDYWSPATVYTFGPDNDVMLVPKEAGPFIKEQVYDYPHIQKKLQPATISTAMDVIFISYDEPNAEKHWNILKAQCPRAKRIQNIKGQTEAYHAAAHLSETEWFYIVFPKLEVLDTFDFSYQPDRLKNICHYIFYAKNPVNDLEYGHGAIVLYNKQLTLSTISPKGLDFTLSSPHDTVPIVSAINHLDIDPWMAWRTAFREVMKLKQSIDMIPSVESTYRLKIWTSKAKGPNGEWVLKGSNDASDYYDNYKNSYKDLIKSYDFAWLKQYFENRYGKIND